ncbi:ROK family transcriptional regulator [Brachybacterium sp. JHP9]|uniref:ROK family transcriptional regulator n=1 Tax=Brachybacterium equifaecis TaxID=2910770 RepID=A0ABT0R0U4_9MICO|nr:ROK family transcriptional regulator [Brachybacterium equifaecis]MCL6423063.1 ROK family transcriptional regulator [Brachybacterium equifaecis]
MERRAQPEGPRQPERHGIPSATAERPSAPQWPATLPDSARTVFRALLREGAASRRDLAQSLGLSMPTLTRTTRGLLDAGLLRELPPVPQPAGRPVEPLDVEVEGGPRFIGVKITRERIYAALTTVRAEVREELEDGLETAGTTATDGADGAEADVGASPEAVADRIAALVGALRAAHPGVAGIGVSTAARVSGRRRLEASALLGWPARVPLAEMLEERTALPVSLENDLFSLAQSRIWHSGPRSSFALITVGEGAGIALVHEGVLVRGAHHAAGLTGAFPLAGPHRTVAEATASAAVLERARAAEAVPAGATSGEAMQALREAARRGDPGAEGVIAQMRSAVAQVAAGVVAIADPASILLAGETADLLLARPGALAAEIRAALPALQQDLEIRELGRGFDDWAHGAAIIAIQHFVDGEAETAG